MKNAPDIDTYIADFPPEIQNLLLQLKAIIKEAAPKAMETISYGMPAFKQHKVLVYFAANKQHIGFYPTSQPIVAFEKELADYKTSKGAIQFPLNKPLPKALIQRIVQFRVEEDQREFALKKKK